MNSVGNRNFTTVVTAGLSLHDLIKFSNNRISVPGKKYVGCVLETEINLNSVATTVTEIMCGRLHCSSLLLLRLVMGGIYPTSLSPLNIKIGHWLGSARNMSRRDSMQFCSRIFNTRLVLPVFLFIFLWQENSMPWVGLFLNLDPEMRRHRTTANPQQLNFGSSWDLELCYHTWT